MPIAFALRLPELAYRFSRHGCGWNASISIHLIIVVVLALVLVLVSVPVTLLIRIRRRRHSCCESSISVLEATKRGDVATYCCDIWPYNWLILPKLYVTNLRVNSLSLSHRTVWMKFLELHESWCRHNSCLMLLAGACLVKPCLVRSWVNLRARDGRWAI